MTFPTSPRPLVRFGTFEVDLSDGELRHKGIKVKLQEQPFRILAALLEKPGSLVTREQLRERLWPSDTFVDFEHSVNAAVKNLRRALHDDAENPRFIETVPKHGYKFIAAIAPSGPEPQISPIQMPLEDARTAGRKAAMQSARWLPIGGTTIVVIALSLGSWVFLSRKARGLTVTDKDTIVLADFTNTTGDAVFDDTLKQGLAVQLDQSPFLNVLSDQKVQDTLKLMGRSPGEHVTPELARDLCQRTGSKAYLSGAIAGLGSQYVIALNLVNCQSGDFLAQEQVPAGGKEQVLKVLDEAVRELRGKVGESLTSIQKFDVPIEQATTASLDALKAYSLGMKIRIEKGSFEAIPFFKRAIERDPSFASAYASLGSCYMYLAEPTLGAEYVRKAFELRQRTSEHESLRISNVYLFEAGEMEKALETGIRRKPLAKLRTSSSVF